MTTMDAGGSAAGLLSSPSSVSTRTDAAARRRFRRYLALDDFEVAARRRLPRMIFGYVDGAVETGSAMRAARAAFADLALVPRVLVDVSGREQTRTLFGTRHAAPFGIAPLGGAAMVAYRGDVELAAAARDAGVPMVLSASSLIRLEEVREHNPALWFQAYLAGDEARIYPMIARIAAAGIETLVLTVDTAVPGNREHNTRSGFAMPLRLTPQVVLDSVLHPRWLIETVARTFVRHGVPHFENMDAAQGPPVMSRLFERNMSSRDRFAWRHVEAVRRAWPGRLVIKGLLSGADARIARDAGADGLIVSNHGGRQLDYAVAPMAVLPEILDAAPGLPVMLDGGIRRGTDVLKALALGAAFVFLGRPFLYAAALAGRAGVGHALHLLREEVDRDMALLGLRHLDELTPGAVRPSRHRGDDRVGGSPAEPRA